MYIINIQSPLFHDTWIEILQSCKIHYSYFSLITINLKGSNGINDKCVLHIPPTFNISPKFITIKSSHSVNDGYIKLSTLFIEQTQTEVFFVINRIYMKMKEIIL